MLMRVCRHSVQFNKDRKAGVMAKNKNEETNQDQDFKASGQHKRLANAKVSRPEDEKEEPKKKKSKKERKETARNVAITVFAVLLVLSMMVPSLATIVSNARNAQSASQTNAITGEQIDEMYQSNVSELEAALEKDPKDLESLRELGNTYMTWAYATMYYFPDETSDQRASDYFNKSRDAFDRYLAIEDSSDVKVERALCDLYSGNVETAQETIEGVVEEDPNCANGWLNLGMIYESTNPDAAAMAYERAIAADPDDEAQVKSMAQERLDALNSTSTTEATTDATAETTTDAAAETKTDATAQSSDAQANTTSTNN